MKLKMRNGRASAVLTGVLLLSLVGMARATLIEGFESGALNGSEATSGDVGIRGTYFTSAPSQGTKQLLLTTINDTSDAGTKVSNQSGTNAVSVTTIAPFLGISAGSIRDGLATGQEGSAFTINLGALNVGDVVSFDYDFLTSDFTHSDFAFWELNSGAVHVFADTSSPFLVPTSGNSVFGLETGYHTVSISITAAGSYTLGIAVMDATTTDNQSGLLIDNIQVTPVPEPTTVAFSIAGASLLLALRRRIKRTA